MTSLSLKDTADVWCDQKSVLLKSIFMIQLVFEFDVYLQMKHFFLHFQEVLSFYQSILVKYKKNQDIILIENPKTLKTFIESYISVPKIK